MTIVVSIIVITPLSLFFKNFINTSKILIILRFKYTYSQITFQEELFQQRGLKNELAAIRDCLDTGVPDKIRILGNMTYVTLFL